MKFAIIIAVLVLLSEAGPTQPSLTSVPLWYTPCTSREGRLQTQRLRDASNKNMLKRKLIRSLTKMIQQLNITMEQFKNQLLNDSYEEIQSAVNRLQYVPKWVPGMGNVLMLFGECTTRIQVWSCLPTFHKELQKFAIALEGIIQTKAQRAIVEDTNTRLIQFLCEVEQTLIHHQIGVPAPREERSLMVDEDRNPPNVTRHLIRDWGILVKYRDYLYYWRELLRKMGNQRKNRNMQKLANNQIPQTRRVQL